MEITPPQNNRGIWVKIGIIAIAAVMVFGFTACGDGGGGGGGGPEITISDTALHGTWVGTGENSVGTSNGTLVITANNISSPTPNTMASMFVNNYVKASGVTRVESNNFTGTNNITAYTPNPDGSYLGVSYKYEITGQTLTIKVSTYYGDFTGTK